MTYQETVDYLASLAPRGWRLELDRMTEFLSRARLDDTIKGQAPKFIHVAGTNGKGSVTEFVQSLLIAHGFRTGGYFSPFVYDLRERVQFNHKLIPQEDFARLATSLRPISDELERTDFGGPTEFEFKTALAFAYWQEVGAEFVSLEVGLGGRLDATNVIVPVVSVIVSIGLDHTSILGDTLAAIAFEKAGIIKPGKPVVVGSLPTEALSVVEDQARACAAPLYRWGHEFRSEWHGGRLFVKTPLRTYEDMQLGLYGAIQGQNAAVAIMALEAAGIDFDDHAVADGLQSARIPGRFEIMTLSGNTIVLDGAHNHEAMSELVMSLNARFPNQRAVLITNMVQGHAYDRLYSPILPMVKRAIVAPINFHRALQPKEVGTHLESLVPTETADSVNDALDRAIADDVDLIVVTGSFYLVGEVGNAVRARLRS